MGSKNRIAKHLLPIMLKEAEKHGITKWVEPFVGGGGMIDKVPDDFECVWQGEIKTNFASNRKKATHNAVEKLFLVRN